MIGCRRVDGLVDPSRENWWHVVSEGTIFTAFFSTLPGFSPVHFPGGTSPKAAFGAITPSYRGQHAATRDNTPGDRSRVFSLMSLSPRVCYSCSVTSHSPSADIRRQAHPCCHHHTYLKCVSQSVDGRRDMTYLKFIRQSADGGRDTTTTSSLIRQ